MMRRYLFFSRCSLNSCGYYMNWGTCRVYFQYLFLEVVCGLCVCPLVFNEIVLKFNVATYNYLVLSTIYCGHYVVLHMSV